MASIRSRGVRAMPDEALDGLLAEKAAETPLGKLKSMRDKAAAMLGSPPSTAPPALRMVRKIFSSLQSRSPPGLTVTGSPAIIFQFGEAPRDASTRLAVGTRRMLAHQQPHDVRDGDDIGDEGKSIAERIAESTKQYSLIIIHLAMAVVAFIAAAIYVNLLVQSFIPSIKPELPSQNTDYYVLISIINLLVAVFATYFPLVVAVWVGLTSLSG